MIIDTTEVQDINSFSGLESFKEVYGILWILVPILILVLGITISVLAIVWLEREISAGIQQRIGPEYAGPFGILQALAARRPPKKEYLLFDPYPDIRSPMGAILEIAIHKKTPILKSDKTKL